MNKPKILVVATRSSSSKYVQEYFRNYGYEFLKCERMEDISSFSSAQCPVACVFAEGDTDLMTKWIAQLKFEDEKRKVIVIYNNETKLDFKTLRSFGADALIHYPFDEELLSDLVMEYASADFDEQDVPSSALVAIPAQNLMPLTTIDFDLFVFLPTNQRHLKIRSRGSLVDERVLNKIERAHGKKVFIRKDHITKFSSYVSTCFQFRGISGVTPFSQQMFSARRLVPYLISDLMEETRKDYSQGKQIFERAQELIKVIGIPGKATSDIEIYEKIMLHSGLPRSAYYDLLNASVFCSHFARIIGEKNLEAFALAGTLHNVGLTKLSSHFLTTSSKDWSRAEWRIFSSHPSIAAKLFKERKVPLAPEICRAVEEQLENFDGSGTPKGLKGEDISVMGRLVKIALTYHALSSYSSREQIMSPIEVFERMVSDPEIALQLDAFMTNRIRKFILAQDSKVQQSGGGSDFKPALND